MIRHTILFRLKSDISKREVENVFTEILDITSGLPGIISVTGGTCHFHEKNNFATFSHGFSIDFENHNAREEFMLNPITLPIKSRIVDIADGGHAGIVGFDFGSAQG